jgi:outer membrane protein assembly factor BamB
VGVRSLADDPRQLPVTEVVVHHGMRSAVILVAVLALVGCGTRQTGAALARPDASAALEVQNLGGSRHALLWRQELSGVAVTAPVVAGTTVLLGTDHGTIEVVDMATGSRRSIPCADTHEIRGEPFVLGNRAYVVLDDHLTAIDLDRRVPLWSWPPDDAVRGRFTGGVWMQWHDIIPGAELGLLATANGGVVAFEIDCAGKVVPYQVIGAGVPITGAPVIDHPGTGQAVLYVPAGNRLAVGDASNLDRRSLPRLLYSYQTRGDILGRPVPAPVIGASGQRQAILISDRTGVVTALDADPSTPMQRRVLGSWWVGGTTPTAPDVRPGVAVAFVATAEGQVVALDLRQPGQVLWHFPAMNGAIPIVGGPMIGDRAVYVADGDGVLHALDVGTGAERWRADLGSPAVAGVLAWNGRVYVPTKAGLLMCFAEGDD